MTAFTQIEGGGVTSALGFKAAGIHAGFRKEPERRDLALVVADEPCAAAGTFTKNIFCSAPVIISREHLSDGGTGAPSYGTARAVVVNSGIANAATGVPGLEHAREMARITADAVGCTDEEVLVASTGVIGQHLPLDPFKTGVPQALAEASREGGASAARAIMTTDTHPKEYSVSFSGDDLGFDGVTFTVGGMSKGSGMIMPNMATMISVLTTDAPIPAALLHKALSSAVNQSFNKVTVDGDTSTNDTCVLFASGKAAAASAPLAGEDSVLYAEFCQALNAVTQKLARKMASDGEGATKLVTVTVRGAANDAEADLAARTVANSPLVKTAIYGHDANWGRIAGALGRSGAKFAQENVDIDIMGMPVLRGGLPVPFSEEEALRRFEADEIVLEASLGAGDAETTVWTCDFSHEYVSINGDYRS